MDFSSQHASFPAIDTGLLCLAAICRFHQLPVQPRQLVHEYGDAFDAVAIQRAAKALGLRCKRVGAPFMAPGEGAVPAQGAINRAPTAFFPERAVKAAR